MREEPPLSPEDVNRLQAGEKERLTALPSAPDSLSKARPTGVLLSDEIKFYIEKYKLIDPHEPDNIMAASYELRIGSKYAIGDKVYCLAKGDVLTFPKFGVVIVEILETINMPDFLIGRWNIRTRWAYEGLIWVGGPQVNPGFRGKIMCPLWNLSDKEISIPFGEAIAVMDFSTTTHPTPESNRKPLWNKRSRYVFQDYLNELKSGLVTLVAGDIENLKTTTTEGLKSHQSRMDLFISVTFSGLGILVAAVAIIATKPSGEGTVPSYWWDPTVFWLCSITAILTLFAFLRPAPASRMSRRIIAVVAILAIMSIGLQLRHQMTYDHIRQQEIDSLKQQIREMKISSADLDQRVRDLQKAGVPVARH